MSLNLPAWDRGNLSKSPLALAVCQVRYDEVIGVTDSRIILDIHKALGGKQGLYPKVERVQEASVEIQLGHGGVVAPSASTPSPPGWRLSSQDERWTVAVMPSYVALETTRYTTWSDDFKVRLADVLDAVQRYISPSTEQRLGLRYVDRITEPIVKSADGWKEFIAPELLGPILHSQLGPAVLASQQQIDLDVGDGIRCSLRHGSFPDKARDGALTYLIDFDIYREGISLFDIEDIKVTADAFNKLNVRLFQQTVTPKLLEKLK